MQLDKALVPLRPRSMWAAADVGVVLARHHLGVLLTLYAVPALMVALAIWLLGVGLDRAWLIMWWLKPMFEAPLTAWIGRAMFGDRVSWRGLFTLWRQSVGKGLIGNLLLRRLHWGRGVNMCVIQLEGATGNPRRQRQAALAHAGHNAWAMLLMMMVFELLMTVALIAFLILMLPSEYMNEWVEFYGLMDWLGRSENIWGLWVTLLIQTLIAPFFVCTAFMLYINARTKLEAWDLDIAARRMQAAWQARKLTLWGSKLSVLLVMAMTLTLHVPVSDAQPALSKDSIKRDVEQIYKDTQTFGGEVDAQEYVWKHTSEEEHQKEVTPSLENTSVDWALGSFFSGVAGLVKLVFFGFLLVLVGWLVWRATEGMRARVAQDIDSDDAAPQAVVIPDEQLPDDIARVAEQRLHDGDVRGALALLYRGTLEFYAEKRGLLIRDSDTEQDCWRILQPTVSDNDQTFIKELIVRWSEVAYGHREASSSQVSDIIGLWRAHYGHA